MAAESAAWTWKDVVARLREEAVDTVVQIAVSATEDPSSAGLHPMPTGADGRPVFGTMIDEQTGIIVQVSGDNYEARLWRLPQQAALPPPTLPAALPPQQPASSPPSTFPLLSPTTAVSPPSSPPVLVETRAELVVARRPEQRSLASFPTEQPGTTILMTTLFGTLLGAAFGGAKGAMAGALIGGGAGLASIAVSTAATSPATAFTAQTMFLGLAAASLGGKGAGQVLRLGPAKQAALPPWIDEGSASSTRRLPRKK